MNANENDIFMENLNSIKVLLFNISKKQEESELTLKSVEKTLTNLHHTVVGNSEYGQKGLVSEIFELKQYVEKDKLMKNKITGGLIVIGVAWTILLKFIEKLF